MLLRGLMRSVTAYLLAFFLLAHPLCPQPACGEVLFETLFQGTPRNDFSAPTATMPGWGSAVVFLRSTTGPILSVDFATEIIPGINRGIYGRLGQRWTSPGGNGSYTETSPGPINVANAQNDFSLDSHFIGDTTTRTFTIGPEEGNVLFPGINPIPSTAFVGYGAGVGVGEFPREHVGFIRGKFDLPASAQADLIELAYLTYGGQISMAGTVITAGETANISAIIVFPDVPEPSCLSVVMAVAAILRRHRPQTHPQLVEGANSWRNKCPCDLNISNRVVC